MLKKAHEKHNSNVIKKKCLIQFQTNTIEFLTVFTKIKKRNKRESS